MKEKYFSTMQVAKILGVSRIAIFKKIQSGSIKAMKVGRNYLISKDELLPLIKKRLEKERNEGKKLSTRPTKKAIDEVSENADLNESNGKVRL